MAENSKIEWCDHTVNLWWGCDKVHTGCKFCYAEYLSDMRYKKNLWGSDARQKIKSAFTDLDRYQKQAKAENKLFKIFCGSMMDIFEISKQLINPDKEFESTADLRWKLFRKINEGQYNNLIFLFLTKRPENITFMIPFSWKENPPKNVWFGTSVSNYETANVYVNRLKVHYQFNLFLSIEPQIDDIYVIDLVYISWVIQGGESGHKKRKFNLEWAYRMKEICAHTKTPYFFKQIDKIQAIPEDLNIKEFPNFEYEK